MRDNSSPNTEFNRGLAAFNGGDYDTALRHFSAAVELGHDDADAHNYLGLTHLKQGRIDDAMDCFVMAAHFRPDFAEAYYNLALAAQRRDAHREAVGYLQRALAARADYAEAYTALGASLLVLGDPQQAAAHFGKAVELRPDDAHAHSNLGYVLLRDLGEYERGAAHLKTALNLNKNDADIWCNYCSVLLHEGRLDEAISVYDQLLTAKPNLHEARLNRALAALMLGRFAEAWPDYEARKLVRSNYVPRPYAFPEWRDDALAGKTVLVYAEQGLGDEIMFASCLPDLLGQADKCILECSPRLAALFRRSFPGAAIHAAQQSDPDVGRLAQAGPIDYQVASGSLPGFFRRQWADFPRHAGYLRADPARIDYWHARLRALGTGLKVGISWRGGMLSTRRDLRSTALCAWLPLLCSQGCHFVSLQYGDVSAEVATVVKDHAVNVHHWQQAIDDYDDTAALVSALDLVISVQTAVVHLAGALGKSVWVMLPASPEWRYLSRGTMMPWYPSARLFRQQPLDGWQPTIAAVAAELAALLKA